jgi:hypothetical protein
MQQAITGTFYLKPVYKKGRTLIKIKGGYLSVSNTVLAACEQKLEKNCWG